VLAFLLALVLSVTPQISFAPATLRVKVQVPPEPANRLLVVTLDGEDYFRSTDIQLDGADAPKTSWWDIPHVPQGDYDLSARVYDSSAHLVSSTHREVIVKGMQ